MTYKTSEFNKKFHALILRKIHDSGLNVRDIAKKLEMARATVPTINGKINKFHASTVVKFVVFFKITDDELREIGGEKYCTGGPQNKGLQAPPPDIKQSEINSDSTTFTVRVSVPIQIARDFLAATVEKGLSSNDFIAGALKKFPDGKVIWDKKLPVVKSNFRNSADIDISLVFSPKLAKDFLDAAIKTNITTSQLLTRLVLSQSPFP